MIKLSQKLDAIHVLGDSSSNVVITIETDGTICNSLGSLTIGPGDNDAIRLKSLLELMKEPRGRGKTTDEPDGFHQTTG